MLQYMRMKADLEGAALIVEEHLLGRCYSTHLVCGRTCYTYNTTQQSHMHA